MSKGKLLILSFVGVVIIAAIIGLVVVLKKSTVSKSVVPSGGTTGGGTTGGGTTGGGTTGGGTTGGGTTGGGTTGGTFVKVDSLLSKNGNDTMVLGVAPMSDISVNSNMTMPPSPYLGSIVDGSTGFGTSIPTRTTANIQNVINTVFSRIKNIWGSDVKYVMVYADSRHIRFDVFSTNMDLTNTTYGAVKTRLIAGTPVTYKYYDYNGNEITSSVPVSASTKVYPPHNGGGADVISYSKNDLYGLYSY